MKEIKTIIAVGIAAVAVIVAACVLGSAYLGRGKSERKIEVVGMAQKDFVSDLIVWNGSFSKQDMDMKTAFRQLKSDEEIVRKYLLSQGVAENEMVFSSVSIDKDYDSYYENNHYRQIFKGYLLRQNVTITSNDLEKIEKVSRGISSLIDNGIEFESRSPNFFYTKLTDLKLKLIEEATQDGRSRAEKIAQNANAKLGKLVSADLGVFQITGQNSNDEYLWGGAYNTSSKNKTANITVRLKFEPK
ncbi:MAG: SIMPL domain-containing protein [Bacteroidales bacterium]|nr:SIMPL domain-containing protein [Bacteroidales bacterium]